MNKKMIIPLITGVTTVFFGVSIFLQPRFYDEIMRFYWDFTAIKYPLSFFLIIVGIYFIVTALRYKK